MLTPAKRPPGFLAKCDKCGATLSLEMTDIEAARAELVRLGWLEAAQRGKQRERWHWWCPSCAPKPSMSFGRSTGDMGGGG